MSSSVLRDLGFSGSFTTLITWRRRLDHGLLALKFVLKPQQTENSDRWIWVFKPNLVEKFGIAEAGIRNLDAKIIKGGDVERLFSISLPDDVLMRHEW
eukprot:CAMPEP_0175842742 /NCGR_PEP_ID=MMETSP0107_2-20121207/20692_1 /TAXON_ID=195067 ORGANISM="Goniomonas pacifica, Strain CCMP1869" /NCGR_SAMPLE_ID=MMETSP0107_2 /ASSEMBLY_ACC=CAM_ASM_000203 /LENGTH=97 /DNA_ID=CAMNT_0017156931 /DNA_START=35 /DNA_END=325 /DNA_ORIENTATION=+